MKLFKVYDTKINGYVKDDMFFIDSEGTLCGLDIHGCVVELTDKSRFQVHYANEEYEHFELVKDRFDKISKFLLSTINKREADLISLFAWYDKVFRYTLKTTPLTESQTKELELFRTLFNRLNLPEELRF